MQVQKGETVCVAIDKDKGSQHALKWAIENLVGKGKCITLLHVEQKPSSGSTQKGSHLGLADTIDPVSRTSDTDSLAKDLFLPFRCFCRRKDIHVTEILLEDVNIGRALCDYVRVNLINNLVLGAASKNGVGRFKASDVAGSVLKGAPEFCSVYSISRGKVSSVRNASVAVPNQSSQQFLLNSQTGIRDNSLFGNRYQAEETYAIQSPFNTRGRAQNMSYGELSLPDTDISFISSGRPSIDGFFPDSQDMFAPRCSNASDNEIRLSFGSPFSDAGRMSWSSSSQTQDELEAEMRRLNNEPPRQTMDTYTTACKEALLAKHKAMELQRWKKEERQKLEDARLSEEAALALVEKEKAKCKAAIEAAEAAQRIAQLEALKRIDAEMKALKEAGDRKRAMDALAQDDVRYRKYTIVEIETATDNFSKARKIGEGGYGPVYKCTLDHTPVAVKVLRPDASQGRSQFQQEVEVLSCMRHPNMVLLLGACPDYGCLVYEYMANGSLEDRLFRRGNTPVLPWQLRFQIAAEIGTGLLFLHQAKPEPLVHRDLKPANILLDRNYVSKIADVGLARLVPPSVADSVTQYLLTSAAGTFCYIDPEYQQTGMLGIKSDIYSLGVMLLQLITAKLPMGLTHQVGRAIEKGRFADILDPGVPDWPVEEALSFAKLALKCTELRRKDRPDLATVIMPELQRLRRLSQETMPSNPSIITSTTVRSQISDSQVSGIQQQPSGHDSQTNSSSAPTFSD